MNVDRNSVRTSVGYDGVRSVAKVVLAIASLLLLALLARFLPGLEHVVPAGDAGAAAVLTALVTAFVVGLLVYLSSEVGRLLVLLLDGPPVLVRSVASIVRWTVVLAALLAAHLGLSPLMGGVLGDAIWTFDVAVLLLTLPVLLIIAIRLYVSLDPAARYIADSVTGTEP